MPVRRRQLTHLFVQVLLSLLVLGAGVGRVSGVAHLVAAALAPYSCAVCRGCPVDHAHQVCDCTACEQVAAGVATSAPSVHDVHHPGLADGAQCLGAEPSIGAAGWSTPTRPDCSRVHAPTSLAALSPVAPPEPLDPPPRA